MELLYDGKTVEFEDFDGGEVIKINLHFDGEDGEGIWAMLRPDDQKAYDNDESGKLVVCSLRNKSLHGVPWGAFILAELQGSGRPSTNLSLMDGKMLVSELARKS